MNDLFNSLAMWLADVLLLGTALLLLAHAAFGCIRQPAWRMSLAWGTLLSLLLLAVLTALPVWPRQSLLPSSDESLGPTTIVHLAPLLPADNAVLDLPAAEPVASIPRTSLTAESMVGLDEPTSTTSPLVANLVRFWLCGATLAVGWILLGAWQAARLLRRSQASPVWSQDELAQLVAKSRRAPRLRVSERIATAVALGARRPHIVLPAETVQPEDLAGVRAALAHEWAHIRHGDLWLLALERLLLPLFFWHPLFWLFRRRVRFDQELLADAAAAGEQPLEYAEALVAWAKSAVAVPSRPPLGMAALSLWENPQSLTRRVEMILQAKQPLLPAASRLWRTLVLTSLLAVVLGLSLVTLRPTAVAQEESFLADYTKLKKEVATKKKKQKKAKDDASSNGPGFTETTRAATGVPPTAAKTANDVAVELNVQILELDQETLAKAELDLGEFIHESTNECRLENGVIIAGSTTKQVQAMLRRLQKERSAEMLSRPTIITLSDQEARLQVGSEIPLIEVTESANGKSTSRIEFKTTGIELSITPHLHPGHKVELAILLEHSRMMPATTDPTSAKTLPAFKKQTLRADAEALLGEVVILAEHAPARKKGEKMPATLLVVITPQQVGAGPATGTAGYPRATAAVPAPPRSVEQLNRENDQLREQVKQLQAKVIDLHVQLAWLRNAATPEGSEKVSDETFLRRAYLDILGVPPTVDDTRAFLNEKSPEKRGKLIDRLLASPQHGDQLPKHRPILPMPPSPGTDPGGVPSMGPPTAPSAGLPPGTSIVPLSPPVNPPKASTTGLPPGVGGYPAAQPGMATPENTPESVALRKRLHDLDIREAEITLKAARAHYDRSQALMKTGNGVISQQEMMATAAAVERAQVALELIKVRGDRVKEQQLEVRLAEGLLRAAKTNLELISKLVQGGQVTQSELEAAQFEVEKAEVALERQRARLEALQ